MKAISTKLNRCGSKYKTEENCKPPLCAPRAFKKDFQQKIEISTLEIVVNQCIIRIDQ
jgi:hypothetical protein